VKYLLSGSNGYICSQLHKALQDKPGLEIFGYDILANSGWEGSVYLPTLSQQREYIEDIRPDVFIHLGAQTDVMKSTSDPLLDANLNILSTLNAAKAVSELGNGCHFVNVNSGGAIYGAPRQVPVTESELPSPKSFYGLSKLTSERYLQILGDLNGLNWSSLALSNVYGPSNRKGVFFNLITNLMRGTRPIIYAATNTRDYIHVEDVIQAIQSQVQKPSFSRIHISSGQETSNLDLYNLISKAMNVSISPIIEEARDGEISRSALDNTLAFKLLGWSPLRDIESSLQEIINSYI